VGIKITRTVVAASALAFGLTTLTVSASAAPMTLNNCGTNQEYGVTNCMYIDGSGLKASEIRGWSTNFGTLIKINSNQPVVVQETVSGPDGQICSTGKVTESNSNAILSCQTEPNPNEPISAGQYCSTVTYFRPFQTLNVAENCGNAPV
jgi:hypothetical protein